MRSNPLDGPGMGYGPAARADRRGSPVVTVDPGPALPAAGGDAGLRAAPADRARPPPRWSR